MAKLTWPWLSGCIVVLWTMLLMPAGYAAAQTPSHLSRSSPNLVSNPSFNGTGNWSLTSGAQYSTSYSRTTDGTGGVLLPVGGRVGHAIIAVTPGKTYTAAAYIKSSTPWPAGNINLLYGIYNASGGYIGFGGQAIATGNSRPDVWEEIVLVIVPTTGTAFIDFVLWRDSSQQPGTSQMFVDEVYLGEGVGFGSPPTAKMPFNGADVTVDALGNMQVKKGGVFQNFFPFCIYSDGRRPNAWQMYSTQGFNCDMWGDYNTIVTAANATSTFNPDGMMTGMQVAQYMAPGGWGWDPGGINLTNAINAAKASGKFDSHLLLYYWDNENIFYEWQNPMNMVDVIKNTDKVSGVRTHPMYILQGAPNINRAYRKLTGEIAADMTGTYTDASSATAGAGVPGSQEVIQNQQNQETPVVVAQANIVHRFVAAGQLRRTLYAKVARGARGVGLWRDCYVDDCSGIAAPIEQVPWWPDVPNLRRELDQLLPLIRQPPWTTWQVSTNTASTTLTVGTRDYQGKGHLLVINETTSPVTVTFTLSGLSYAATQVSNYFTGAAVASVSGNSFTTTIGANGINSGTAVYRLDGTGSTAGSFSFPLQSR